MAQVERDEVGDHAGCQGADVVAVEHFGAAQGSYFQRFTGGHGVWAEANPLQQQGLAHFADHAGAVIGGRTVYAQANRNAVVTHLAHRGNAGGQAHVRARAVGNPGTGTGEQLDAMLVELYAVGVPDVVADPAEVFGILGGRHAEFFTAVGDVVDVLGEVGVQRNAILARQHRSFAHQVAADRERRAGRHDDAAHRPVTGIVVVLDQALRLLENVGFLLDHRIWRQAALALPYAHAAARGMEAHADLAGSMNAVV